MRNKHQRLALAAMFALAAANTPPANAQAYTVLHRFTGSDGAHPSSGSLIGDPAGSLFGTTVYGGASGFGTVFKLDKTGATVLFNFTRDVYPNGLIRDSAGNLYGTTWNGGVRAGGTAFKLDTAGAVTVLYSFGQGDGAVPAASLIPDSAGNLYGTTLRGGPSKNGTVFKLFKTGVTVLYSFTGGSDGGTPLASLIQDSAGNLYGTTSSSGAPDWGTVFKLDPAGVKTILYRFTGGTDGANPVGPLMQDSAGNLYGTTIWGGLVSGSVGRGVVFKLDPAGTETVRHAFTGGADGANPEGSLVQDPAGNLYGTAPYGGTLSPHCPAADGCGVVFKLDPAGTFTVLYNFTGEADGAQPFAGLFQDSAGNLFGTASSGGIRATCPVNGGCGVVFRIVP